MHSASLRRLSTKTQVWQAGADDFVRNRLTHSLEVAQIGRELALSLGANPDIVDAACLAHDLGHPPFGHFGETVLNEMAADIGGFEGNAQTFRSLTRLEAKTHTPDGSSAGLNLTRATLDAVSKYPWPRGEDVKHRAKFGVYADDLPTFDFVRAPASQHGERRCLEAQIMDWSDDVAYSVHDVEDGVAAGAIPVQAMRAREHRQSVIDIAARRYATALPGDVLEGALDDLLANDIPTSYDGSRRALARLKNVTSTLIGRFAIGPELATRERFGSGPLSRYDADLEIPQQCAAQVAVLKATAAHFIMLTSSRAEQLGRQREIILTLLEGYLADPHTMDPEFQRDLEEAGDDASALRVIVDQVASLTDQRAWRLAQHGMSGERGAQWQG